MYVCMYGGRREGGGGIGWLVAQLIGESKNKNVAKGLGIFWQKDGQTLWTGTIVIKSYFFLAKIAVALLVFLV